MLLGAVCVLGAVRVLAGAQGAHFRNLATRSIASFGVRGRKTFDHGCGLTCGNLYSE